jgi:hypothetical protein
MALVRNSTNINTYMHAYIRIIHMCMALCKNSEKQTLHVVACSRFDYLGDGKRGGC